MEQKLSDTLVKAIDRSNPMMQNLQLASRFNKLVEEGGSDLEDNHATTIDVSAYTDPVEVTPTAGKDGMKKNTVTLSNIPVAGFKGYAWNYVSGEDTGTSYFSLDKAPSSDVQHYDISKYGGSGYSLDYKVFGGTITKISDTEFTCEWDGEPLWTYTRDTTKDFVIEN